MLHLIGNSNVIEALDMYWMFLNVTVSSLKSVETYGMATKLNTIFSK